MKDALADLSAEVHTFTSARAALDSLASADADVLVTDLGMPEMSGFEVCDRALGIRPDLPVVVLTARADVEAAVSALRAGAYDFLTKPIEPTLLALSVERALTHTRMRDELRRLRHAVVTAANPESMVGASSAMRRVFDLVARIASSDASVLIQGETGTGKELIARAIHAASRRADHPFVAINCASVPANLIESELFGHVRGAFTDAKGARGGLFAEANRGTLFLDEVGELPLEVQPKLLRALQERKVRPVGSNVEVPFDARVVTATNRDLDALVHATEFREDLYYRLNVVNLELPPLRERAGDVLLLARHFLAEHARRKGGQALGLSDEASAKLMYYRWPGNVRELENCIARGVALAASDVLMGDDLPERVRTYVSERVVVTADDEGEVIPMAEMERRYVARVLGLVNGNKTRTAELLGFDRRTLYRKLERWGLYAP